jgi:hypothetical protein
MKSNLASGFQDKELNHETNFFEGIGNSTDVDASPIFTFISEGVCDLTKG